MAVVSYLQAYSPPDWMRAVTVTGGLPWRNAQANSRDDSEGPPLKGQAERAMARRWFTDLLGWAPFTGASASAPRASPGARLAAGRHPVLAPDLDEHVMAALHG